MDIKERLYAEQFYMDFLLVLQEVVERFVSSSLRFMAGLFLSGFEKAKRP